MMASHHNPNRSKIHRNYTVEEVAELYSVHKNTVRNWIKNKLPVCDDQRPALILGSELREYLQLQRKAKKQKCRPYEMYCMRCKSPQRPAENMVDYKPFNNASGRLIGICSGCESMINKFASFVSMSKFSEVFDITFPPDEKHINKRINPLLNSDLNTGD